MLIQVIYNVFLMPILHHLVEEGFTGRGNSPCLSHLLSSEMSIIEDYTQHHSYG